MSRPHSFFLSPDAWGEPYVLTGGEASHLARVLRLRQGETVRLFDGLGTEGLFRIARLGKRKVDLELLSQTAVAPPARRTFLAAGWNKSSRRAWLLEKAVELRAAGVIFWQAARSQGRVPEAPKDSWREALVAGAKQSDACRLPELAVSDGPAGLIAATADFERRFLLWEAPGLERRLAPEELAAPGRTLFTVGPEGGLTDREAELFMDAGFVPVSLGRGVLRWETAALVALGLAFWADSGEGEGE